MQPAARIETNGGVFFYESDLELRLATQGLAAVLNSTGGLVVGRTTGDRGGGSPGFAVDMVDGEVDPETGKTQILGYTALPDRS